MVDIWAQIITWLSWSFWAAGSFFVLVGVIGILRMPDTLTRLHAASLTDSLGLELILIGLMLHSGLTIATVKLLFIAIFILFTGPTATHALANAVFISKKEEPYD